METPLGHHIDAPAEQALDTLAEVHEGETAVARLEFDEQVDVAVGPRFFAGHRAEHPDAPDPVARAQRPDLRGQILRQYGNTGLALSRPAASS